MDAMATTATVAKARESWKGVPNDTKPAMLSALAAPVADVSLHALLARRKCTF